MLKYFCLIVFFCSVSYGQSDWVKWEAKQISYARSLDQHHDYTIDKSSFGLKLLSFVRNTYYFLVSDVDGDNCPFYPSCSAFFVHAVKEANIFKASLMFSDRFIRDMNLFKNKIHYPLHKSGKYFDPAYNYTLDSKRIKLFTGDFIVQ